MRRVGGNRIRLGYAATMRFPRERILVMDRRHGLVPEVRDLLQKCQNEEKTGWLSIKADEYQHLIFLTRGNFIGAGSLVSHERQATELDLIFVQLMSHDYGIVSFYESKENLMKMLLSTFQRPATRREKIGGSDLKKLIRKCLEESFTGFLEIEVEDGLNFLFFLEGVAKEIFPCDKPGQVGDVERLKEFLDGLTQVKDWLDVGVYEFQVKRG